MHGDCSELRIPAGWHCCCVCAALPHRKIVLESGLTDTFLCHSGKCVCLSFSSGSGPLLSYYIKGLCWSQALIQQPRRSLSYSELLRKGLHFYGVILRDMQRGLLYYYFILFFYHLAPQMPSALTSQELQTLATESVVSTVVLLRHMAVMRCCTGTTTKEPVPSVMDTTQSENALLP